MANKYYVPGGTNSWSSTANWSDSATLTPTGAALPTSLESVFFTSATTYTVTNSVQGSCLNFNITAGTVSFSTITLTWIYGNINWTVPVNWTSTGSIQMQPNTTGTKTILIASGTTLAPANFYFQPSVAATFQLLSNLTFSGTAINLNDTSTLHLNGFDVVATTFQAGGSSPSINFGTNSITVSKSFAAGTAAVFTTSGTPTVYLTGAVTNIQGGTVSESQAISFSFISAVSSTITIFTGSCKNVDFTNYSGTISNFNPTIYGNLTFSSTMTVTTVAATTLAATSGIQNITSNGITVSGITVNGVGTTVKLVDALTLSSLRTFTLTNGTLDLNSKTLTTGLFSSNNSNIRTIVFGTSTINCLGSGTVWEAGSITNFTITGTPIVNISNNSATAATVQSGARPEASSISFNFTTGTYALTFLGLTGTTAKNVDFTGFAGTLGAPTTSTIYGNLTLSTGMALTTSASVVTFGATSGTQIITSNTKTMDFSVAFNGVGGTFLLFDNMVLGPTATSFLTNGTLDLNGKTLTTGLFSSTGSTARTLAFGTGNIICNAAGGTLWATATVTNLTVTGTPVVNISNSGAVATSVLPGILTEANSISFNFTTGTYSLTFLATASYSARNVDFTGFAGTWASRSSSGPIYGNLTLSSAAGFSIAGATALLTFGATSGVQLITSNGKTIDTPITCNGVGGTVRLADALLMGTTRIFTQTNGTLDLNGKTLTVGTRYLTATGTKNLTFNGGTLVCPVSNIASFNNAVPTGFTTTAGTGTGKISMAGTTSKAFGGGGATYNCTLSNDATGVLTISGSNTFTAIANGVQPTGFTFTAGTTQTVTDWNVNGTAGNLVTIISSTAGVPAILSKASGTVSSNYLSLKDSTALGGAAWYAGTTSTNVSGNLGWIFTAPPATGNSSSFFFMF